jgi:hypothetical protein
VRFIGGDCVGTMPRSWRACFIFGAFLFQKRLERKSALAPILSARADMVRLTGLAAPSGIG